MNAIAVRRPSPSVHESAAEVYLAAARLTAGDDSPVAARLRCATRMFVGALLEYVAAMPESEARGR